MSIGSGQLSPHSAARFSVLATVFLEQPQLAAISVLFNPILSQDFIQLVVGTVDDTVDEAMQDATPAVLRIDSSRGTVFKDNNVSTVLTVSIHYGSVIIENATALHAAFGNSACLQWEWLRMDEDRYGVISSSDSRLSNDGFSLTLGPADIDVKVTFRCKLITD